jgi:hypothetical protein
MDDSRKKRRARTVTQSTPTLAKAPSPKPGSRSENELMTAIISKLSAKHKCSLDPSQFRIDESLVKVGAMNATAGFAFDVHPKPGPLNSGVKRRICQDILKLSLVKTYFKTSEDRDITVAVILGDKDALDSFQGITHPTWMKRAADMAGVEVRLAD